MNKDWNESEDSVLLLSVSNEDVGKRLDQLYTSAGDFTRSAFTRLIENGSVLVNGKAVAKNYRIKVNDQIRIELPEPEPCEAIPQNIPLNIIYSKK